ncbi:MAG: inositol monophosphatase family protein [Actinomycetota bacterium]
MGGPTYVDELAFAEELADRAGDMALSYFRHDPEVTWKADATPVTEADLAIEAMIREELGRRFPDDAIRGEEGGIEGSSERMWIVDPIDGTRNYAAGIQIWANLLALKVGDEYVLGLVNAPALGERYAAVRGEGATWNGEPMHVSDVERTADGMIVFGDMEAWAGTPRRARFLDLVHGAQRNRGFGDFWGHMLVARGAAEVMIEPSLWEWDFAPLVVIVTEAGGRVTQVDGTAPVHGGSLVSSNGLVHDEVLGRLTG